MEFGISTSCFYPEYLETAVDNLTANHIKNIEIFVNTQSELKKSYIKDIKRRLDNGGTRVISMHPFTSGYESFWFFTDYQRRFDDAIELYKGYFDAMNILGAKILVFHGNKFESNFDNRRYFERFAKLREVAKSHGVTLAQENVVRFKSRECAFLSEMKEYLNSEVEFVLDIKQSIRSKQNVFDIIDALKENIIHIHVSDNDENNDCLPIGKGNFDFYKFYRKLLQNGFRGTSMLELYRHNYGVYDELYESVDRLYKIAQTLK